MYFIDVYAKESPDWLGIDMKEKSHPQYGLYWQIKATRREKNKITRKLERRHIKYRCYEEKWERSSNYRETFFRLSKPPYRCRYCHKKLKPNKIEVDHIIPVGKVKKSTSARMLLYLQGISDVNHIRNLAPSCEKCNQKKSSRIGFWWIRGILGRYKLYWIFRKVIFIALILTILWFLTEGFTNIPSTNIEIIDNIINKIQLIILKFSPEFSG